MVHHFTSTALGLLLLLLPGCASYVPDPLDPGTERERLAARGLPPGTESVRPALPSDLFPVVAEVSFADGLSLAEANALALFHAPELVEARSEMRIAEAQLLKAGLLQNPELFAGPRLSTADASLIFPASLGLRLPLSGRLGAEKSRAVAEARAAAEAVLAEEIDTLADVRRAFAGIAAIQERIAILEAIEADAARAARLTQDLVESGEADQVDAGIALLERDEAAREAAAARLELARRSAETLSAIGLLPGAGIVLAAGPELLLDPADLPPPDPRAALRHPRLKGLEAAYEAAERQLQAEVARQYPDIVIGPEFESDAGETSVGIGVGISLPVFDTNRGAIAVATERRRAAREAWQAECLALAQTEASARSEHASARQDLRRMQESTLPAADAAARALEARVRRGQASLMEAIVARRSIAQARRDAVDLRFRIVQARLTALVAGGHLLPAEEPVPDTERRDER